LVKAWHAIESISSRIERAGIRLVRLKRAADVANVQPAPSTESVAKAVAGAWAAPLDFPPLASAMVPGDRVAVVVDERVPSAAGVVRGTIDALHAAGVDDGAISIVTASGAFGRRCRADLQSSSEEVASVTHDPRDEHSLCLVGVPKRREPLLVNRTIYDADVVLPIGCARLGGHGAFDSLFPAFAGAEAVERYLTPAGQESPAAQAEMTRETAEAGRLMGPPLVMQIVPGPGETVGEVVAGGPTAVTRRSAELCRRHWAFQAPHRASLVIALVGGDAATQTWEHVGRALAAAERLVAEDGAVAICTNLDAPPLASLNHLVDCSDLDAALRKISHEHFADSVPAWHLARALLRGPVYLLSQLDAETVEELGMAPVTDVDELIRLAGHHESCIVLEDAQHAVGTVEGEDDGT
jgi:nickel-dependent lactate racemase